MHYEFIWTANGSLNGPHPVTTHSPTAQHLNSRWQMGRGIVARMGGGNLQAAALGRHLEGFL